MDTSETYIKMCTSAYIQENWKPEDGDWANSERDGTCPVFPLTRIMGEFIGRFKWDHIWLPRQDQIQDMMYRINYSGKLEPGYSYVGCPDVIVTDLKEFSENDCEYGLETMEQLWLAFYMKRKEDKVWNGEEWK